jgi:hypothetical protein
MFGLIFGMSFLLLIGEGAVEGLLYGLAEVLVIGLVFGLVLALGFGLLQTRTVLTTSRTPKEARSRSLIAALTWLLSGLLLALGIFGLGTGKYAGRAPRPGLARLAAHWADLLRGAWAVRGVGLEAAQWWVVRLAAEHCSPPPRSGWQPHSTPV